MKISFSNSLGPLMVVVAGAAIVLFLNIPQINGAIKSGVYSLLGPVQANIWAAGANTSSFFERLAKMNSAAVENEELKKEIIDMKAKLAEMEMVKSENNFLRQGLNLELDKDFDLKLANVVAKNVAQDIIVVDKGSRELVEEGMPVITAQRAVVGRVLKVYDNYSEILLVTAKDFSFDVKIGEQSVDGLVKGNGSNAATIDLVPKDMELSEGVTVSTSQMGGIFPAGLLVGTVSGIRSNDIDTFQQSGISLAFDVNGTPQVFVASTKLPIGLNSSGADALQ